MSKDILEIRWHGRGGQGAKTAALLFGDAALDAGLYIQAFPEYGPERMGAPVASFNRLSKKPIYLHCAITEPSLVVINGLPKDGKIIVNTTLTTADIRKKLGIDYGTVCVVDASGISKAEIGREIPNTPMLGALLKVSGLLDFDRTIKEIEIKLNKKFKNKPEIIAGNLNSIRRAYEEVKSE